MDPFALTHRDAAAQPACEWISPAEAATVCRVSENTMKAWMRDELVISRVSTGGARQVHRPSIEAWLCRLASSPAE